MAPRSAQGVRHRPAPSRLGPALAIALASCFEEGGQREAPASDLSHLLPELTDMAFIPAARVEPLLGGGDVWVAPFFVDRFETTNEEFQEFVQSRRFLPSSRYTIMHWRGTTAPAGKERHPVVFVTFDDAAGYARFRTKRLPTDLEWRAAARKYADYRYPWGPNFSRNLCNSVECGVSETTIVGTFESGKNDYDCYDFAGNVWEWVDSSPPSDSRKMVLGGSFTSSHAMCSVDPARSPWPGRTLGDYVLSRTESTFDIGFRCVRDLTPELIERIEFASRVGSEEVRQYCEPILKVVRSASGASNPSADRALGSGS